MNDTIIQSTESDATTCPITAIESWRVIALNQPNRLVGEGLGIQAAAPFAWPVELFNKTEVGSDGISEEREEQDRLFGTRVREAIETLRQ